MRKAVIGAGVVIVGWGCNPLKKMVERANEVSVIMDPNPLVNVEDSVRYSITVKIPANYFHKKVKATVTPVLKDAETGQEVMTLQGVTLLGEKVEGEGVKIAYEKGGSATMSGVLPYDPKLQYVQVYLKITGQFKSKTAEIPINKAIGKGTIITHKLVQQDEIPLEVRVGQAKPAPETYFYDIHFDKAKYNLRPQEVKQEDVKKIPQFIVSAIKENKQLSSITIDGYASPEGEIAFNNNLSVDRTKTAQKHLSDLLKSLPKSKEYKGQLDNFSPETYINAIRVEGHGEDWTKFKADLEASDVKDKDLILRILQMYQDPNQREKEIRNLSKIYDELEKKVLPKQRRAEVRITVLTKPRTREEIVKLARENPAVLTIDELLFAGSTSTNIDEKLLLYRIATERFGNDWRGWNNLGYAYLLKRDVNNASRALEKAYSLNRTSPEVNNNLGIIARWQGDLKKAEEYYKNAGSSPEASYNLAVVYLARGRAAEAIGKIGDFKTLNAALINILAGNPAGAPSIVDASKDNNTPVAHYIKAIAGARTQNKDLMIKELKAAISKDNSFRNKAKRDCEFIDYREDSEFKALLE